MTAAEFVLINSSYGYGCGDGRGYGRGYSCGGGYSYGDGYGYSCGGGYGDGYGDDSGDGSGDSYGGSGGCDSGYGGSDGDGYGGDSGDGRGRGCGGGYSCSGGSGGGRGYGRGHLTRLTINAFKVYDIDDIDTIIYKVKGNIAKGAIINADMTLTPCYIVKEGNIFAHGETLHEANKALQDKLIEEMPIDERIDLFLQQFDLNKKYPATDFFEWHHKLTDSCLIGRQTFCKNHNINIDSDSFTVGEFIELTQNDYNGEVIKALADRVKKEE